MTSRNITKDELYEKMNQGESIELINVLEPSSYLLGFIKGSKKIPLSQLESRLSEIDKTKEVIVYCASYDCTASRKAAEKLAALGYNVKAYEGGLKEWNEADLPMEPGIQIAAA